MGIGRDDEQQPTKKSGSSKKEAARPSTPHGPGRDRVLPRNEVAPGEQPQAGSSQAHPKPDYDLGKGIHGAGTVGLMEERKYDFQPSLVSRAANTIAISLWSHAEVLTQTDNTIRKIEEDKVIGYVKMMNIPNYLKQIILLSIRPVQEQINHWKSVNGHLLSGKLNHYKDLVWTHMGLLDTKATADNIIASGQLQPVDAFKLACVNCTILHIFKLWPQVQKHFETIKLPEHFDFLPDETIIRWVRHQYILEPEVLFWVSCLKKGYQLPVRLIDEPFFHKAYLRSFYEGNMSSLTFFFQHTDHYKGIKKFLETPNLMKTLNHQNKIPILLFFLTLSNNEWTDQFFRRDPVSILLCFLEWPLHEFFMQVFDEMLPELDTDGFSAVSQAAIQKMLQYENEAAFYRTLFTGLWKKTPSAIKCPCLKNWMDAILTKLFAPKSPSEALDIVSFGTCDVDRLCASLLPDAETLLDVFIEENKHRALKGILKSLLPTDASFLTKFDETYEKCTEKYLKMYYCM